MATFTKPVGDLADFMQSGRSWQLIDKDYVHSEAVKRNYFLTTLMRGRSDDDLFRAPYGGTKFEWRIKFATNGSYGPYNPYQEEDVAAVNTLKVLELPFSMNRSKYPMADEEEDLNSMDLKRFVNLKESRAQDDWIDQINGMEAQLWATPVAATMETADTGGVARVPMSMLAFITRDGLAPATTGGDGVAVNWTTIQQLNPTTYDLYRNPTGTYTAATPTDPDAGIIPPMDTMHRKLKMERPPTQITKYAEDFALQKLAIVTNGTGQDQYVKALRAVNDRMERVSDPSISLPQHFGIPVMWVEQLDALSWTYPDYIFINGNYIKPVFHSKWYFLTKEVEGGIRQPNVKATFHFTWWQLACASRRLGGGRIYGA